MAPLLILCGVLFVEALIFASLNSLSQRIQQPFSSLVGRFIALVLGSGVLQFLILLSLIWLDALIFNGYYFETPDGPKKCVAEGCMGYAAALIFVILFIFLLYVVVIQIACLLLMHYSNKPDSVISPHPGRYLAVQAGILAMFQYIVRNLGF